MAAAATRWKMLFFDFFKPTFIGRFFFWQNSQLLLRAYENHQSRHFKKSTSPLREKTEKSSQKLKKGSSKRFRATTSLPSFMTTIIPLRAAPPPRAATPVRTTAFLVRRDRRAAVPHHHGGAVGARMVNSSRCRSEGIFAGMEMKH